MANESTADSAITTMNANAIAPKILLSCRVGDTEVPSAAFEVLADMAQTQSMNSSAKRCGHSFSFAWNHARTLQNAFNNNLIERKGEAVHGSKLTQNGMTVTKSYLDWAQDVKAYAEKKWTEKVAPAMEKAKTGEDSKQSTTKRKLFDFYNEKGQWETLLVERLDIEVMVTTHKRPITQVKRCLWCEIAPDGTRLGRFFTFTDGEGWLYNMAEEQTDAV